MFAWIRKAKRKLLPLTLSRALEIVRRVAARNGPETDKFDRPITILMEFLGGDVKVADITPEQLTNWYKHLKERPNAHRPDQKLSLHTINSYGRLTRSFFNHLVKMGHLEKSPWTVTIGRPPKLHRKDISQDDIDLMVKFSGRNARDKAIVLLLKDSGCRVGELISMTLDNLHFEKKRDEEGKKRWVGHALVYGQKMNKWRYILFRDETVKALKAYLAARPEVESDKVWLAYDNRPLTTSGVYQMLERVGKAAGVKRFNPHAFRHAKTKELYKAGVPEPVIQALLGHEGVDVTRQYVQFEPSELLDMLYNLPRSDSNGTGQIKQSPRRVRRKKPPAS